MTNALMASLKPEKNPNIADVDTGDTVRVHQRITEGRNERIQVFQGVVIAKHGGTTPGADVHGTPYRRRRYWCRAYFPALQPRASRRWK